MNNAFSKVLLVRLTYKDFLGNNLTPPIGLGYIAEALKTAKIDYAVFDMGLSGMGHREYGEKELFKKIKAYKPELIGITMQSLQYRYHYEVFRRIKKTFPNIALVLGGHHLSSYREKVLQECNSIDFGVILEGEKTIVELCEGKPHQDIKGLIFRREREIISTGERKRVNNLDIVSYPRFEKFPMDKYLPEAIGIITTRGCPFDCTYCSVALSIGKKISFRSPVHIADEIDYWYKKGKRKILIYDDNFTLVKKHVLDLCEILKERGYHDLEFAIPNGVRADKLTKEILIKLKEVGFKMIGIGVESANDDVLAAMKKGEKLEDIDRAVKAATELGFKVYLFFIIGMPEETPEGAKKSMQFALKYPVAEAAFFNPIPYPGTELYEQLKANNCLLKKPEWFLNEATYNTDEPCFETPVFSVKERKIMLNKARKVSRRIRTNTKMKKMEKYRGLFLPLAYMLAYVASTRAYQHILNDLPSVARVAYTLRKIARIH